MAGMQEKEKKNRSRAEVIFGNPMSKRTIRKAEKSKQKYIRKFGDDSQTDYPLYLEENKVLGESLGVQNIKIGTAGGEAFDTEKGIVVGNIRMGFGHYRISIAIASAAHALGYTPYWMDLNSYQQTTGGKVIDAQNQLYSLGSRISGKSRLFNRLVWEPMNYEGFRKITYNASDQKNAELMTAVFKHLPKEIPVVATHVWPAQAAVHAGMPWVVNAIPDNWPMALHLAEGSLHTVQTYSAYYGYRLLRGMNQKKVLHAIPKEEIAYTGHYIDHELVFNIEEDCRRRCQRVADGKPTRFLLTIGGAGAQKEIFRGMITHLLPALKAGKAALLVNVGDYKNVWEELLEELPQMKELSTEHFENWKETEEFALCCLDGDLTGIHGFYHKDIFEAVYATNLLMRCCDYLVTKPSELAFYPVPKLFIKRVGGHERWGSIHSSEIGDGSPECDSMEDTLQMLSLFMEDKSILKMMCQNICENKKKGMYDGAYKVVQLAMAKENKVRA